MIFNVYHNLVMTDPGVDHLGQAAQREQGCVRRGAKSRL